MNFFKRHQLAIIITTYWILLVYIIALLVWWFVALLQQQHEMMQTHIATVLPQPVSNATTLAIKNAYQKKVMQYLGEGLSFLAFLLLGAIFVYRSAIRAFRLSQQQNNFMLAITHELKTPVAVVMLNIETMQRHTISEEKKQEILAQSFQESKRLNTLCENILLTAQLESNRYTLAKEKINLSFLLKKIVQDFSTHFSDLLIHSKIQEHLFILGEEFLLQIAINNLVDNAIKYAHGSTFIKIELAQQSKQIILKIIDDGVGISNIEKKKIFRRFYRIGNESTRKAKGTGLGLYLCRKIIEQHKGHIYISNNFPHGALFTIKWVL